jgi:hypothetical protein
MNYFMPSTALTSTSDLLKVDSALGIVFGYAIVCRECDADGTWTDHFDTQGHHIPEAEMLQASVDFAQQQLDRIEKRASKDMHEGDDIQEVVLMLPVTEELAKALDWNITKTGLVIGMKPTPEVLEMYKNGERTGFSIGGRGQLVEEAE